MKKYYIHIDTEQEGPFDIEDLKLKEIHKDTPIWYDGLDAWISAEKIIELQSIIKSTPPSFNQQPKTPPPPPKKEQPPVTIIHQEKKGGYSWLLWLGVIVLVGIILFSILKNNPNAIPGVKVMVQPPRPVVITSRGDDKNAELTDFKETIYATVQNQGGEGSILVTINLHQDANNFVRTQLLYLKPNESRDIQVTFDEVKRFGGKMSYEISTQAQ